MDELEDKLIHRYLLDELLPDEQEQVELRLLSDSEFQELVQAGEYDLIDDYLRGDLTADEATRFERHFLLSPARQRKLETARVFTARRRFDQR